MMNVIEADLTCISGLSMGWSEEYVFSSIDRSLQQILQHLENARSTLISLQDSQDLSSSSVSDIVGREAIPPSCYCTSGNRSYDSSVSSVSSSESAVSSSDSSNPSYLPVFPGGATWQLHSHSLPAFSRKEPPAPRSQGSSLPTFQQADLKKSDLFQNLAALPPLKTQRFFINSILENLDSSKQENTINKRKNHLAQSGLGPNSVLNESPGPPLVRAPLQLSPLVRGELEGHMSHKVSTLRAQVMPLPVKKSWEILNHFMDVQGVPEQGLPKTQLPTLLPQRAEQNTNRSPDAPSFHVHVNIGVNSELSRTEVSQPLTSNKQLESANDRQVLSYNPVVTSMGTPAPINIVREEKALLKKDPRHVLELNIDQRVLGLPEKRIQPQRAQVTDMELTAQVPRSATDSVKVTPVALLQVMGLMGMIPESHAQVIDSVGFPPQPPNQAETVSLTPRPSDQPKTVTSLQHSATESKSMASRLSPVTDKMKVTPVELLRIMDSMGLIDELYPHVIEPAAIAPKPQYQVMESPKVDTLHGHQAIRPEDKSLGLQQSVLGTVEVIPQPQHKVMGTPNTTLGPQNQAPEHIGIAPGPIRENILEISSSALPKAIDYTKATPVAQQTMDFMQEIPPGQPHIPEPRALIQTKNLTPLPAQPDVLTSAVPRGAAESRGIPPQLPSTALASSGVILLPAGQSPHALKVTPIVQAPPGVGMIPPLQVVEPPGLTPQPELQNVKSEPLIPDPRLRNMKSVDIAMDLVPEKVKYGPPTSRAVSTDLTLELHQLTMQFEELTHMPQLQGEESVPSAPESQLQDVKSGQVIVEAQLQNIQAAGLAPGPQGQSDTSVHLTPGSQTQGMQGVVHSALSQELQGDSKMVELAPRPSLEDMKSVNLTRKPYSQSTSFEKTAHVPLLEDRKTLLLVEGRSLIPEALVESVNLSELVPSTHLCAVKSLEVNPDPSYHFLEPAELALRCQAPEERVGSDICHQVEESVELTQSSLGMRLIPLSQTSDSMEMYSPPLQETLETRNQVVKEMEETPESQNAIKDALDLLPESEVQNMNSAVMAPEPQPSDGKFLHGTLESCSEVTNSSEINLSLEYEDRETIRLTFPKVDDTQGAMIEPYSEMGSLELGLEPGVQGEKSESLAQHLQSVEVIGEPPVLAAEPIALTTGPKPHIKDVIPGPQLEVKLRQMDTESQLQNEESVNVTRQLSLGEVGPEKTKPESGPQSPSPKELIEETQPPKVKSVHLNLGPQQLSIKSGLIPGPQLQSVRFPTFYQGGKRGNFISGPPRYGVKSDEALSRSPVPEIRSSDYIPGPNLPEAKLQHVKPVEVNVGPCLQAVKFSDLTPEPKHQGFRCTQVIPGIHFQDRKSQGLLPESFLPLSQELNAIKPRASKQEELTPGPHLGDVKSMELRSKSERGKVKAILLTPGKQAGDKVPEELPRGPNLKGLKSELLPSRPQLENRKSAVLTVGQCPERIKSTVVSPCSSQSDGTKTVKLIPGSTIQDLKTVGLARDTHVQDANAMGLKLEPKQEESPVTFVPGIQFQDEFMEVLQVPQLQGIKPKELTAQSQMRGRKHVIISCLKPQSLKPVNISKTQGIPGVKLVNLVSTQPCRGMAPTDLTLKPGQDDQITVRSPEWKGRVLDQLSKHFESENVLSMKSGQEAKPADKKPKEIKFKVQFKDTPSFESTPKPVVHSVKPEEAQDESQVPSMKPCQVTPGPQEHQVNVSEPMLEPPFQDVKTMVFTEPHTGSTKSVRWIPISKFKNEKWVGSDLRLQFQSSTPTELKPSTKWRGVRPSELTVRSKITQEEKSVGLHLEPQSQQVKTSPLALGLQKTKTLNLTSEPQPQGIKTVDQNKDLPSPPCVNSSICTPGPSPPCVNSSGCTPKPSPPCVNSSVCTPESSPPCVNSSVCTPGPSPPCVNSSGCTREPSPPCMNSTECNSKAHFQGVNSACIPSQNPQCEHSNRNNLGPLLQGMHSDTTFPAPQNMCVNCVWCSAQTHLQNVNSSACTRRQESQSANSMGYNPGPHLEAPKLQGMKFPELNPGTGIQREMPITVNPGQHLQDLRLELTPGSNITGIAPAEYNPGPQEQCVNFSELNPGLELQCINLAKLGSGPQLQNIKSFASTSGSGSESRCTRSVLLSPGPPFQGVKPSNLSVGAKFQEIPFLKKQFGSRQQTAQPMLTQKPQSTGVDSVEVLPTPLPEDKMFPEMSKQPLLCTNSVNLTPGYGLQDFKSKEFSLGPCFQTVMCLKPGSQSQSGNSSEFAPCHGSQCAQSFFAPKPCLQDLKPMELRLGSHQQSMNCQQIALDETPMVVTQESTRKSLAGPALTSVKFSDLIPESQSQCMKFKALTSELRGQSVKHVKLSSVSLPRSGNSVGLSPSPFLQNVTFGNQIPQTNDQITEPSKVTCRPVHHLVDYAEMNTKIRYQAPKLENYIPLPVYQEDAGSSEMTKGFRHKSTETTEKSMRLFPKPTDTVTELLGMPQQPELQVPGFADLTPTLSDQDSNASELTPQKNYQSLETLEMLSCSWPQVKDFKQSQTQPATGSKRMTLDLKNHATEMTVLTRKVRQQEKEFLRVTSTPVNRETECVEKSPWPYPQDLGPVMGSSEKRSPREQSVASSPRPFYHVPDSAPGITPGPQIPESVGLTSKPWLQREKFLELATQPTNQVVGNTASVELTFEECQTEEVGIGLTTPQKASIEKANVTPIESLDQIINFVTVSPKPLDQMTEPAKTQLQVPQVSESLTVIPGPPVQVIESVMIPEPTSQGSKYVDLTPKLHDRIVAEFAPRLWLQNVQSKKLIAEPTHHILETIELSGFQVIKTILLPKPLLLIVKSEELAPGPSPQAVEPIGVATRSRTQVKDPLNLLPRPHLQDKIKPIKRTRRADIQETFPELIVQQTFPLEEPPVLTHKQRLQAGKSVGLKRESPKVLEMDLNQGRVCQNRASEMITSEKLQAENYFSRFISSPPIPFISSSVKTSELGPLQGSGRPEVSRARTMKNSNADILQSPESYTETIRMRSPALPLVLPSDKTGNSVGSLYPEIWDMDIITKESTEKKQMEEFGNLLQSYAPYPLRLLPSEFQAGLGARRNSIRSFLGRQLNIWESHVCRQRLPRKYLSNMLMLGNVLGTTMERKLCSQPFLTEGATMDICRSIQNLFGVPAELMEFSQSLLERGPRTISQTSVAKNYIQRHILGHGHEKRMPLKMWTRGSTSSIIQQYSGTRLGLKKTNSKLSDILQEVTQHVPVSCTGAQFPALGKPESPLGILYNREDPVSREPSKTSQSDSQTGTFESHRSKSSYFSQTKTDHSEQLHLLKDLQLKVAAKLLRSQIPHNVPPPPGSGLVLKYPICLQCGQCSGYRCGHELQSGFGSYLLIYPQIHLIRNPEGHGETRLHLGFRLRIRKRPHISKHHGRNRADTSKSPSSLHREAKMYTPASKSPTSTRDFQPRSSQSPASVPVHRRQKQWGSCGVAGKTEAKDSGHYEFCEVLSTSESGSESNRHEKWAKSRRRKMQNIKFYKNRPTEECPSGTLTDPSRSKSIKTAQTSTVSSKRQPKKSSQPRFIQLLFQRLKQAFQRVMALTAQKPEDRASPDNLWSSKNLYPKEKDEDDCLTGDGRGASTPVIKQRFMGSTPKKEDRLQKTCDQAQQSKQVSSLQRHSPQTKPTSPSDRTLRSLSERRCRSPSQRKDRSPSRRTPQSISDRSLPRLSKGRGRSPAGRSQPSPSGRRPRSSSGRSPCERRGHNSSPKGQLGLYGRNQHSPPFQRCRSPSKRSHLSPIRRTWASSSERSHSTLSERPPSRHSGRTRHSSSGRGYRSPSKSRLHRPSGLHRSHSQRTHYSPSDSSCGHFERSRRLERNQEGHHARPHHSPKGKLRHSSPKERPRHSTLQGTTPETYVWYMGCW
ncbi:uncharacterized protein LOC130865092 isoform X1 [Chionomys nivalis]|uniref:uncharacterized protein LOC130865092 isoform X1 n=1 Tax=Chionomys nivalis TaxID=269649 RepID=UPI0025925DB4|nr:uncharacterized protein LOC130865092 isoform X1 [Chionomys nivalis]